MRRGIPRRCLNHSVYMYLGEKKVLVKKVYFHEEVSEKTNDLGTLNQKNALLIIDRKSSLAYLENGEKINLFEDSNKIRCGDLFSSLTFDSIGKTYKVSNISYINVSGKYVNHIEITGVG